MDFKDMSLEAVLEAVERRLGKEYDPRKIFLTTENYLGYVAIVVYMESEGDIHVSLNNGASC